MSIAHNLLQSGVKELQFEDFTAGLKAVLTGENLALTYEEAGNALNDFFAKLEKEQAAMKAEASKK